MSEIKNPITTEHAIDIIKDQKEKKNNKFNNFMNGIDTETDDPEVQKELENIKKCKQNTRNNIIDYLVRGAILVCEYGTHRRMLNLPVSHGVYIDSNPVMHEEDCKTEILAGKDQCNITFFGICKKLGVETPGTEYKVYKQTKENSADSSIGVVQGFKCTPIIAGVWKEAYGGTVIEDEAANKIYKTITTQSYLTCIYGGIIYPVFSGQSRGLTVKDMKNPDDYYDLTGTEEIDLSKPLENLANKKSGPTIDTSVPFLEKENVVLPSYTDFLNK